MTYVYNIKKSDILEKLNYKDTINLSDYIRIMRIFEGILGLEDVQIKSLWGIINPENVMYFAKKFPKKILNLSLINSQEVDIQKSKVIDLLDMIMSESTNTNYSPYQMIENLEILMNKIFRDVELNEVHISKIRKCNLIFDKF